MKEELEKEIIIIAPWIYKDYRGDMQKTCMAWGFECGDGWFKILKDLTTELAAMDVDHAFLAEQVKEKFGGLRFYYSISGPHKVPSKLDNILDKIADQFFAASKIGKVLCRIPYIKTYKIGHFFRGLTAHHKYWKKFGDIVTKYENLSYHTCEICGEPGTTKGCLSWITTLCESCMGKLRV